MKKNWENRSKPYMRHITSLFENEVLGAYLAGHLVIESILVIMLETDSRESDKHAYFDWSFHKKIEVVKNRNLISLEMAEFLYELNKLRNQLVHRLDTSISFEQLFNLAQKASMGGVEFSDGTIHSDHVLSEKWYGVNGIIQEIFQNASQSLLFLNERDDHLINFMSSS